MHGQEVAVGTVLDGALAMAVYKDGTLLGLLCGVAAYVDEGFDDVVEGVHVVVVKHYGSTMVFEGGDFVFCLWADVWFLGFQFCFVLITVFLLSPQPGH